MPETGGSQCRHLLPWLSETAAHKPLASAMGLKRCAPPTAQGVPSPLPASHRWRRPLADRRACGNWRRWSGADNPGSTARVSRSQQVPPVWSAVFGSGISPASAVGSGQPLQTRNLTGGLSAPARLVPRRSADGLQGTYTDRSISPCGCAVERRAPVRDGGRRWERDMRRRGGSREALRETAPCARVGSVSSDAPPSRPDRLRRDPTRGHDPAGDQDPRRTWGPVAAPARWPSGLLSRRAHERPMR